MKVHEKEKAFEPVTITLETKEELKSFLALVNASGNNHTKFVNEHLPDVTLSIPQQRHKPFTQRDYVTLAQVWRRNT